MRYKEFLKTQKFLFEVYTINLTNFVNFKFTVIRKFNTVDLSTIRQIINRENKNNPSPIIARYLILVFYSLWSKG